MDGLKFLMAHRNMSQTIIKLKPMKSPSTPPQSATRLPKEKASSSLRTCTDLEANNIYNPVPPLIGTMAGSSIS